MRTLACVIAAALLVGCDSEEHAVCHESNCQAVPLGDFFGRHESYVCQRTREALDRAARAGWVCDLYLWRSDGTPRFDAGSLSSPEALALLYEEDAELFGDISLCKLDKHLGLKAIGTDEQPHEILVGENGIQFDRIYLVHVRAWAWKELQDLAPLDKR